MNTHKITHTKTLTLVSTIALLMPLSMVQAANDTDKKTTEIAAKTLPSNHFGVGFNIHNSSALYSAKDGDLQANIHLQYRGQRFNLAHESASYKFFDRNSFQLEAIAKSESRGFEVKDYKALNGLSDRDESLDLGLRAGYKTPFGLLSLDVTKDVSSTHKGHEADLRFGPDFYSDEPSAQRKLSLGVVAGVKWQSDEVVDYYYGVKNSEANSTRAAFEGKAATTPYIGIDGQFNLSKKITLNTSALYLDRPDEITGSPLVDKRHDIELNAGITYWFR